MQDITYRFSMDLTQILRLYTFSTINYSGDYRDSRALIGRGLRHNVCRYNHPARGDYSDLCWLFTR